MGHGHRGIATVSILLLSLALGACGSNEPDFDPPWRLDSVASGIDEQVAIHAVEVALSDSRFERVFEGRDLSWVAVERPTMGLVDSPGEHVVVTVSFSEPLDDDVHYPPIGACTIETGGQPVVGVVWLVSDGEISAVSPLWRGGIACGY